MKEYADVLAWNCYIANLSEGEHQKDMVKKMRTMAKKWYGFPML